ncbi:MAG: c-type cytochrome [Porticoccaceae bacterium]
MKILSPLAIAFALTILATPGLAADIEAGKKKAMTCAACHGANGISSNDMWPNLAGQKKGYLISQLQMFRDGRRNNPMMTAMSKGLSDADIVNLSAYYASLK